MNKNAEKETKEQIDNLIQGLKKYDGRELSKERKQELKTIKNELVALGKQAVPKLIQVLSNHDGWSAHFATDTLGEIGDERAIEPLVAVLEEKDLGKSAQEALVKFGPVCVSDVIEKIEYRLAHPVEETGAFTTLTMRPLTTIGEVRCDESIKFLNKLLDDYMSEVPEDPFDPGERDWKFRNVDFFHLLDCMVLQQDERAIPHIKKARDFYPENHTEYMVCQIAIDRIKKGEAVRGLPMEAMEIAFPSDSLMKMFSTIGQKREEEETDP